MSTTYVVLRQLGLDTRTDDHDIGYAEVARIEADNATQACRRAAERMDDAELDGGVTLIAVPARNWNSGRNTFKAETQRRIRAT